MPFSPTSFLFIPPTPTREALLSLLYTPKRVRQCLFKASHKEGEDREYSPLKDAALEWYSTQEEPLRDQVDLLCCKIINSMVLRGGRGRFGPEGALEVLVVIIGLQMGWVSPKPTPFLENIHR